MSLATGNVQPFFCTKAKLIQKNEKEKSCAHRHRPFRDFFVKNNCFVEITVWKFEYYKFL
jgi:hypothetical protein